MPNTTFIPGTVITSNWLNDTNTDVYKGRMVNVKLSDYGAIGDGASHPLSNYFASLGAAQAVYPHAVALTDELDGVAIQAVIDSGNVAELPSGIYLTSREIVIKDGTGIVGQSPFWKRRAAYVYNANRHSVIKYVGLSGTNTTALRVSKKAVGVQGTDFSGPDTDDLVDIILEKFTVDANSLADYGIYMYRCGNQSSIKDITALNAVKDGMLMLGLFAAYLGVLGSYSNLNRGFTVGDNVFGWTSEYQCFSLHVTLLGCNNGTAGTYVGGGTSADANGCGAFVKAGRGSRIGLGMEGNDGRSCVVGSAGSAGGPCIFEVHYLEGNGAGPRIDYRPADTGIVFRGGFLYPYTSGAIIEEIIRINSMNNSDVTTDDQGPTSQTEWLRIEGLSGSSGFASFSINSNTYKFYVENSAEGIEYTNRRPLDEGVFGNGFFKADSTLSDTRYVNGQTEVDRFLGDGVTTGFTMGAATNGASMIEVYVNGLLKVPTTHYSVSGTTLTFTGPQTPALDAIVLVKRSNFILTRAAAGRYVVTFANAQPDDEYNVDLSVVQSVGTAIVFLGSISTTGFEIRTAAIGVPGTLADTGVFVSFSVSRSSYR